MPECEIFTHMTARGRRTLALNDLAAGVAAGDRTILGRAITLVESRRDDHREQARDLLEQLLPATGGAHRIGVTGVPGVGKSTLIEALGLRLVESGKRVAVLAVDPSSSVSGGSILGDKTRMTELARHPRAFVRPSPSGGSLGGVAAKTRETSLLLEAAGYDVVLIETVGVGQSEILVAEMVDTVLLLLLPGAGDELQGLKRGIVETLDVAAVNKADGSGQGAARRAVSDYAAALGYFRPRHPTWRPPVLAVSALEERGLGELWEQLRAHYRTLSEDGALEDRRQQQRRRWLWSVVEDELLAAFRNHPMVADLLPRIERQVVAGTLLPPRAARRLLHRFTAISDPTGER